MSGDERPEVATNEGVRKVVIPHQRHPTPLRETEEAATRIAQELQKKIERLGERLLRQEKGDVR